MFSVFTVIGASTVSVFGAAIWSRFAVLVIVFGTTPSVQLAASVQLPVFPAAAAQCAGCANERRSHMLTTFPFARSSVGFACTGAWKVVRRLQFAVLPLLNEKFSW